MTTTRGRLGAIAIVIVALALLAGTSACSKGETAAAPGATFATGFPLRVVQDVPLPGGTTRLDYQDIDPTGRRLYIAHLGDSTIHVVDLDQLSVATTITDVASAHGIRAVPDLHRVYASATGSNEAVAIDTATDQIVGRAPTGSYPDGLAYDPKHGKVYVSNEQDTVETVIDARSFQRVASIDIGGAAGNTAYDATTGTILVNVQDKGHLAIIDPATDTITGTIDTPGCDSNHGLYLDSDKRLVFVACESNAKLLVIDLDTKATTATIDIGDSPDVLAFDDGLHRLYIASESGTVTVLDEDATTLRKIAQDKLADGAHTVAVDQTTHRVYFPLENVGGHPVLRVMEPITR